MAPMFGAEAGLTEYTERMRTLAEALKRLPAAHPLPLAEQQAFCREVKAIAAQLRGKNCHS